MNDSDSRARPPHPAPLCARYQPLLALLRTGALSPREAATLTEHISGCPRCQRELATYDALDAAARQHLSTVTFTSLTLEDIMQTSQSPTQTPAVSPTPTGDYVPRTAVPGPSGRPPMSALAPLAAVIALILLAGLIFTTHGLGTIPGSGIGSGTPIPSATPPTVSQPSAALAQSTWVLRSLFVDGHEQPLVPSHAPTLRFQPQDDGSGKVLGNSGCNGYGGSYTLAGTTLHVSRLGYTQMRCSPPDIMDQESAYQQALSRVEHFHLDGDSLTLASGDGSVQLDFHAIHTAALAQSTWTLTQLVVSGHEQPIVPSHAPTLHFQSQGDLSGVIQGTGGCNNYSGSYTLTDTMLRMSTSGTTNMLCTPDVMDEETAYLGALPRVERYYLNGDTLMLGNGGGSVRLTFHATHSAALAQTIWMLTQLVVDGHEQPLAPSHAPTLSFQPQGDLSGVIQGTDGCNSYSGSYTLTDTTLRMGISAITLVGCQSIVSTPEHAYLQALPRIERFQLEGDTLTLASADGSVRLTFHA